MRALIAGGTGFIGLHLVRHLCTQGAYCRVLARPTSDISPLEGLDVELVRGDVTEYRSLRGIADGMDVVYNLAGVGHVTATSAEAYDAFRAVNVGGARNLAKACLDADIKRFVHFSSTAAMGLIRQSPFDEAAPCRPVTPYQVSKREGEEAVLSLWRSQQFPVVVLRPCMVYGPGGYGEFARFCRWLTRGVFPRVGLGANLTPLVHVSDIVQAADLAGTRGRPGEVYLVGSSTSPALADIRRWVLDTLGLRRPYIYAPRWLVMLGAWAMEIVGSLGGKAPLVGRRNIASFTANRVLDISKAREELGYDPQVPFEVGIREAVLWYRESGYL